MMRKDTMQSLPRRILTAVLALCLVVGLMPVGILAAETDDSTEDTSGGLYLDKTAVLEDDGTYTIKMEAYATGEQVTSVNKSGTPLDIVLVLDQSGSMAEYGNEDDLELAVTNFVNAISAHANETGANHRIAMVGFASAYTDGANEDDADTDFSISPGSDETYWVNTGLFVDGYLQNYGGTSNSIYTVVAPEDANKESNYYVKYNNTYYRAYYHSTHGWVMSMNSKLYYLEPYTSDYGLYGDVYYLRLLNQQKQIGNGTLTAQQYKDALVSVNNAGGSVTDSITTAIGNLASNGGTRISFGMAMANDVFANNPLGTNEEGRKRIVVVFTDGEPGLYGYTEGEANSTLEQSYIAKNTHGADVYTVALQPTEITESTETFLEALSSNYTTVDNMADMEVGEDDIVSTSGKVYSPVTTAASAFSSYAGSAGVNTVFVRTDYYGIVESDGTNYLVPLGVYYTTTTSYYGTTRNYYYAYLLDGSWKGPYEDTVYEITRTPNSDKYCLTTGDASELENIFQTIEETITSNETSVTLTGDAVLRDLMAQGFILTDNTTVTATTVHGTMAPDNSITWDPSATLTPAPTVSLVDKENGIVEVTDFDYQTNHISYGHDGYKLVVTITGVEATDEAIQNQLVPTNLDTSGVYPDGESTKPAGLFPVPEVLLTSKIYVLDYARPATLNTADWQQTNIRHLDATGMHYFASAVKVREMAYGMAQFTGETSTTLDYLPSTMQWDGYDNVYVFGKDKNDTATNIWSKVSVLPANNVYYEDDFVEGDLGVKSGIVYTGGSKPEDMTDEEWAALQGGWYETGDGSESREDENGGVHGWIDDLDDEEGHTDGSAHAVQAILGQMGDELPSASFTFTGTGVDIYSFTDSTTGTVLISVTDPDYAGINGTTGKTWYYLVDTFAKSGSYYQVPVVTFSGEYDTYNVKIVVTAAASVEERFTFYLDGIRVYNPLGDQSDETITEGYGKEMNAVFAELRNDVLTSGGVFIDEDAEGNAKVYDYETYGDYAAYAPEHEVYLAKGETISFKVEVTGENYFFLGMKALSGSTATAVYSNGANGTKTATIGHTTDMYYEVAPDGNGIITVTNTGDGILALTKVRRTGAEAAEGIQLAALTEEEALTTLAAFKALPTEEFAPEASETPEEPTEPSQPEIDVENPQPEVPSMEQWLQELLENMLNILRGWFRP